MRGEEWKKMDPLIRDLVIAVNLEDTKKAKKALDIISAFLNYITRGEGGEK